MVNKYFALLPFVVILTGCGRKEIETPSYTTGYVDSTKHIHWGKGFYKLRVYYSFSADGSVISDMYEHKLERSYTSKYKAGDSVLVKYDKEDVENSRIIKITFNKKN